MTRIVAVRILPNFSKIGLIAACLFGVMAWASAQAAIVTISFAGVQDNRSISYGPYIGSFPDGELITGTYTLDTTKEAYRQPSYMTVYADALVTSTVKFHGSGLTFTSGPGNVYTSNDVNGGYGDMAEMVGGITAGSALGGRAPISMDLQFSDFSGKMLASDAIPTKQLAYQGGFFHFNTTSGWTGIALRPVPKVYGVFVGVNNSDINGMADAENVFNTMASNLIGFQKSESRLLVRDISQGGVTKKEVETAISEVAARMHSGDKFFFFGSSHGGTSVALGRQDEKTATPGDEFLAISQSPSDFLYDDDLKRFLSVGALTDKDKWVMLDACSAGGFWGNANANDEGDLEKLSKIALLAAAREGGIAAGAIDTKEGLFSAALTDGFSQKLNGENLKADLDNDGTLTFLELKDWLGHYYLNFPDKERPFVVEREQGDLLPFTPDLWSPSGFTSPDFGGKLYGHVTSVPEPKSYVLILAGLVLLIGISKGGVQLSDPV